VSFHEALAALQTELDRWGAEQTRPRVLDAGCGGQRYLHLRRDSYVVGLDIDPVELERNERVDERILGDVQTCVLPEGAFDLVVCWDVLEHVADPRLALENLRRTLRPDGLLVVGSPNVLSLKGLVTKATPFWLHRMLYRRISTIHPFRTHLRFAMAPSRIRAWGTQAALDTQYFAVYESPLQTSVRLKVKLTGAPWSALKVLARLCSRGRVDLEATDFILVLRRT
jgi:2-polyprenyl-3-methyl-5-hydroxy-6-metoxy-1,4-benzoquinol methylase